MAEINMGGRKHCSRKNIIGRGRYYGKKEIMGGGKQFSRKKDHRRRKIL